MSKISLHVKRQAKLSIQLERQNKPFRIISATAISPSDRADFIQDEVEAVVQTVEVLAARTALIEAKQHDVFSPTEGQSLFGLTFTPARPHLSLLFVNGVKAHYGTHYRLNGSVLEWLNPVMLQADDRFEIFYL